MQSRDVPAGGQAASERVAKDGAGQADPRGSPPKGSPLFDLLPQFLTVLGVISAALYIALNLYFAALFVTLGTSCRRRRYKPG